MGERKYLNEEKYQKNKKKISMIALIILLIGLLVGGGLIFVGINKQSKVNTQYSEENKQELKDKLSAEKKVLEAKKAELEAKGIEYSVFTDYTDGEAYDLYIIVEVLDPSKSSCMFPEFKDNELTSTYCSYKQQLNNLTDFNKSFDSSDSIPFYMFGAFVIIASCMIAGSIYMITKRREIMAFTAQQVVPVSKEVIDEMAPSAGKVAKEIARGIKQGINDEEE